MAMYALTNLRNYAPKGVFVTNITKAHPNVWIVEYKGNRFPTEPKLLSETPPEDEVKSDDMVEGALI